ncbi:putative ribonuclease H-like domain-containing protein, partial [Tanacetum coccineum]
AKLEDTAEKQRTGIFGNAFDDDDLEINNNSYADESVGVEANFNNLEPSTIVSPIPTTRIHFIHSKTQIIGDLKSAVQTRGKTKKVEAIQEELLQFKIQKVWTLVDLPYGKKAIGTKWVYRNKKDAIGIMDVKSVFLYGTIKEEVYVSQPPDFLDPKFLDKVYKVEKALYGLHQAPRAWYETLSTYLLDNGFHRGQINKTLFIKRVKGDILLVQVYVDDIIFGSTKKSLCTDFEQIMHKRFQMSSMGELTFFLGLQVKQKEDGIFISQAKSMIGSLMYLTSFRPDIMFSVCACLRFQVQLKVSHLNAVKRIFRYLKGRPKLGLLYPKDSPFILEAFQTVTMQVPVWTGNPQQKTKIHVDNKSAICVVKNPVYHSKTKHIEIMHHFIRDSYEKNLIEMVKTHTDYNVADLLTKAFNVTRFQFLIASIGLKLQDKKELAISGQTTTVKEFSNPLMAGSLPKTISGSPKRQETMVGTPTQTRSERVLAQGNEPPLLEGRTSRSGDGGMC